MAETLKLNVLSPERRLVDAISVSSVTLPGAEGQIQVLPGHSAMISTLEAGVFSYQLANGAEESGFLSAGFLEIKGPEVTVLAEALELRGEIDLSRAREAQRKAEAALQDADLDERKFKKYQLKLQRALIRQQFAAKE